MFFRWTNTHVRFGSCAEDPTMSAARITQRIYHYRFGLYDGQPSVARLLGEEKKNVAAFLAANPQ